MTTASSKNNRHYTRFIPCEEVGDVTQWTFGAVDGSDALALEAEPEPELPVVVDEEAQQALLQQACDDAYAQGVAQGRAEATVEWQRRLDDYVANQGQEAASRLDALVQAMDAGLNGMQQQMARDMLQLACEIARQVVRQELRTNPQALQPVVQEALGMLVAEGRPATVRLNPLDQQLLGASLCEAFASTAVQWVADAAVQPGGCLVEFAGTVVDGSLEKRWQRAVAQLGLASAWQDGGGCDGI